MPALGISLTAEVIQTFLIIDVGVTVGATVRTMMNITAGITGVLIPAVINKWGDKLAIRGLMGLTFLAIICLIYQEIWLLVFAGFSIGLTQVGLNIILTEKRPNTGCSASMHSLVDNGGAAFSSGFWGLIRAPSYSLLLVPVLVCFFAFERLFHSKR